MCTQAEHAIDGGGSVGPLQVQLNVRLPIYGRSFRKASPLLGRKVTHSWDSPRITEADHPVTDDQNATDSPHRARCTSRSMWIQPGVTVTAPSSVVTTPLVTWHLAGIYGSSTGSLPEWPKLR